MPSDRSVIERQIDSVELRPFTLNGFHRRREQRQRNRRIASAAVAVAVAAAGIGGMTWAFLSGPEPRPADQPSGRFVGTWTSTELDFEESSQTMTIRPAEAGAFDISLHDESNSACSTRQTRTGGIDTPSTLTGTGRLENATTLVVPSPTVVCLDGRELIDTGFPEEEPGVSYTVVLDLATGRLFDNLGVAWHRGTETKNGPDATTGGSERTGPGTFSFLGGEVTFRAERPWGDHVESYLDPRIFWLFDGREPDYEAGIEILANPKPQASCDSLPSVPASAEELVQDIRSNPDLDATAPVAERIGGVDALRLDVAAVPGASTCLGGRKGNIPVVSVHNRELAWGGITHGTLKRLYILDLPGGSARALVITITAPEAVFEQTVSAAAPVIDSFEFHLG